MFLRFECDEDKNSENRKKHGIWFEEAITVFDDHRGRLYFDHEHSEAEERFVLIGFSKTLRLLVVAHTTKDDFRVRIISARRATKKESVIYEKGI